MTFLSIDFETRSAVDLRKTGVYPYAKDASTGIWCFAWAFDGEEPEIWTPGAPFPARVAAHIAAGGEMRAWNAQFERILWRDCGVPRYEFPPVQDEQWVCTAAEAAAMNLPRALGQCAAATGIEMQKDTQGYGLMMRMARPRKVMDDGTIVWWEVPERMQTLYDYCKQDVRTETALYHVLRRLSPREREMYLLDQRINDRGVTIDRPLIEAAQRMVDEAVARANEDIECITGGSVTAITQNGQLVRWLQEAGVETDSVAKAKVVDMLADPSTTERVRHALTVRAEAGRSSVAKLGSMLDCADVDDDRMRGLLLYHGAGTGRWSGRLVQPQNFTRGEIEGVDYFIPEILGNRYDSLDVWYNPIVIISSLLRSMMIAREGATLIAADFSAIEARVLNWLAGQDDIVALFAAGQDVYKHNAARLYGIPIEAVQKFPHRQTGKFQELACGFGMGAKKAVSAAKDVYGLVISEEQSATIVDGYRDTHSKVVDYWYDANRAAIQAVLEPGSVQAFGPLGNCKFLKSGSYLWLVLPSKRPLAYASPRVEDRETPWGEKTPSVTAYSVNSQTKRWERRGLYGGLIVENVVQAVARDLMAEAMLRVEAAGYPVILTVHDEIVVEVPSDFGSVKDVERIITQLPAWAAGCPVAAEGWRGDRYRK